MLNLTGNELATVRAMLNRPQLSAGDLQSRPANVRAAIVACQLYRHESTHGGVLSVDTPNLLYKLYPDMRPALEVSIRHTLKQYELVREFRVEDTVISIVTPTDQLSRALHMQAVDYEELRQGVEYLEQYKENQEDPAMLVDIASVIKCWGIQGARRFGMLLSGATDPLYDRESDANGDEEPTDED